MRASAPRRRRPVRGPAPEPPSGARPAWADAPKVGEGDAPPAGADEQRVGHALDVDADGEEPTTICPLCEAKNPDKVPDYTPCSQCGAPAPPGAEVCTVCSSGRAFRPPEPALRAGQ